MKVYLYQVSLYQVAAQNLTADNIYMLSIAVTKIQMCYLMRFLLGDTIWQL